MAIKEPGHSLIMIRRVRAHDRGLCVPVCVCYMYININLRDVGVEFEQECGLCTCVLVCVYVQLQRCRSGVQGYVWGFKYS